MRKYKKTIAPRLVSGDSRRSNTHQLPPEIMDGLRSIARLEKKSVSWVLEQCIIRYFKLDKPEYKKKTAH